MIDWKNIKDLHVNKKLEQVIGKWFGVDIFIQTSMEIFTVILKKNDFESHFLNCNLVYLMDSKYFHKILRRELN
jgi:hypothetical protein